jgi:hypothetical protein
VVFLPGVWVRRQLCEPLLAHLPPTASRLPLQALFIAVCWGEGITPTSSNRLCLFRVLLSTCPSPFLQCGVLTACYSCSPCLFRVCVGEFPFPHSLVECVICQPLLQTLPTPSSLAGGSPNPLSPAGLFIYSLYRCLPLLLQSSGHPALFATCLFQFFVCYSVFFFFFFYFVGLRSV